MVGKMRAFDFFTYIYYTFTTTHLPLHIYYYLLTTTYLLLLTYYSHYTLHITHFLNRLLFYNTVSHLKQQDVFPSCS